MKIVQVTSTPCFPEWHSGDAVRALRGLVLPLDFEEVAQVFRQHPELKPPATNFLPVPIGDILEALRRAHASDAGEYWRKTGLRFLAIPVQCCQLSRQ